MLSRIPLSSVVARVLFAATLCAVNSSRLLAGNVYTVGGVGGNFADIQSAVQAGVDGDVILVRAGNFAGFTIDNESLTVVADTSAVVHVMGQVVVQNLAVGKKAVLGGLHVLSMSSSADSFFHAQFNAGSLRLQSCELGFADPAQTGWNSQPAARLFNCSDVAFVDCTLRGSDGYFSPPTNGGGRGSAALFTTGSQVALYDCQLLGGKGQNGFNQIGDAGGAGGEGCSLQLHDFLFASGTSIRGNDGGNGGSAFSCSDNPAGDGGSGGDGIHGRQGSPPAQVQVVLLDCTTLAGHGGMGGSDACGPGGNPGSAGTAISLDASSTLTLLPGTARRLAMPTPVRELTSIPLALTGVAGETAYLTMWADARFLYSASQSGVILERAPLLRRIRLGIVPASGVLNASIVLPDLGAGVQGRTYFFQPYFLDPAGVVRLGSPAVPAVLDSAF